MYLTLFISFFCNKLIEAFRPLLSSLVKNAPSSVIKSISGFLGQNPSVESSATSSNFNENQSKINSLLNKNHVAWDIVSSAIDSMKVFISPTDSIKLTGAQSMQFNKLESSQKVIKLDQNPLIANEKSMEDNTQKKSEIYVAGYMHFDPKSAANLAHSKSNFPIYNKKQSEKEVGSMFVSSPSCTWYIKD
jgi:hypothetical protein